MPSRRTASAATTTAQTINARDPTSPILPPMAKRWRTSSGRAAPSPNRQVT
ncbi:hypothetical protein [Nocardioides zhouii]|uniref:hypothetical protein n=1 Tax=Nocardioides zhouii TaxID=1168729 RepID=UPI0013EDD731|nr:hypothetical protein [Nocardioides zhouii]